MYSKSYIKPPGGGLFNLAKGINGSKVSRGWSAFCNNKKMVTILRRELEHKGGKVKHKVGGQATEDQNNMNFQPE